MHKYTMRYAPHSTPILCPMPSLYVFPIFKFEEFFYLLVDILSFYMCATCYCCVNDSVGCGAHNNIVAFSLIEKVLVSLL